MTEAPNAELYEMNVTRRRFVAMAGATAAAAATGAGSAVAQESDAPNFSSDLVQSPRIETTATIGEHTSTMDSPLGYINDNGKEVSLADDGAVVADRPDPDTPHNPVTLRADKLAAGELRAFPRGVKYDSDGDGDVDSDDEPVEATDATHWTKDVSGTAGSATLESVQAPNGEQALHFVTSGQGAGDVALATFDLSTAGSTDATITDGVNRKMAQLVANVNSLASGAVGEVRIQDSAGTTITLVIDSSADSGAITTIATATGKGQVYQEQVGDFSTSLDDIQVVQLAIKEADADFVFPGINLDKEAEWEFGTQEFTNSDSELDSKTIKRPSGTFAITGLGDVPSVWTDGGIMDLQVDAEFLAANLDTAMQKYRWPSADRYDYNNRLETMVGLELPTAYDLSYASSSLRDTVLFPSTRYLAADYASGLSELPTWDDVDNDNVSWTSKTATYENANVDDDVTLTSSVSGGSLIVWHGDVQITDSERDSATASSSGGGGGGAKSSGGGFFSGVKGLAMSVIVGVLGYFGWSMRGN